MDVDFSEVLARSQGLSSSVLGSSRIPRLERQLEQIDRETRSILNARSESAEAGGEGALRLLAEYGYETDKLERSLQSVALLDRLEPYESFDDTNLDAFVRHQHEMLILGAMEENRAKITAQTRDTDDLVLESDWELRKKQRLTTQRAPEPVDEPKDDMSQGYPGFLSPFRLTTLPRSTASKTRRARIDVLYTEVVKRLLETRLAPPGTQLKLAKALEDVAVQEKRGAAVEECLRVVRNVAHEDVRPASYPSDAPPPDELILSGILRYLSTQFLDRKLRPALAAAPLVAQRGGDPSVQADVCAYLRVLFERGIPAFLADGPMVQGMPLWAQLYYLLRCGLVDAATALVEQNAQKIEGDGCYYHQYIREFLSSGDKRLLSENSFARLLQEYTLTVRRGTDPFRRVCYLLLARVDPSQEGPLSLLEEDYHLLFNSIEDYIWLRLSLVRLASDPLPPQAPATRRLSLRTVQDEIVAFGPNHFDPQGRRPFQYVHVLLLTAQFDAALKYMNRSTSIDLSDALHLAIAMYYYHLVGAGEAPLDVTESLELADFPDMLWRYLRQFAKAYPRDAAAYMFVLRDPLLRHVLLRVLILETGEFEGLLGGRQGPLVGTGALDELWRFCGEPEEAKQQLISAAAEDAENSGDRDAAVTLYAFGGEDDRVTAILLHMLSADLTSPPSEHRRSVLAKAEAHQRRVLQTGSSARDPRLERSFNTMVRLFKFFNLKNESRFVDAWAFVRDMNILPLHEDQLIQKAVEWKDGSRDLTEDVTDRIGDIIVAAMECLAEIFASERRKGRDAGAQMARDELKAAAGVLVQFAGILQLPSDVSAKTIRIEVLMS